MSEDDLVAIEARRQAVSEGTWDYLIDHFAIFGEFDGRKPYLVAETVEPEDGEFIAHAHSDVPALVAEVRRLRAVLVEINEELTIPAAEYVPAIPDVWKMIDAALKGGGE